MSKEQKRSNREIKKPKQPKLEKKMANYVTRLANEPAPIRAQREHAVPQR
jgi:hypothetical protein